jgi:5-methylcytosine-specific restriction endonuclease McrA
MGSRRKPKPLNVKELATDRLESLLKCRNEQISDLERKYSNNENGRKARMVLNDIYGKIAEINQRIEFLESQKQSKSMLFGLIKIEGIPYVAKREIQSLQDKRGELYKESYKYTIDANHLTDTEDRLAKAKRESLKIQRELARRQKSADKLAKERARDVAGILRKTLTMQPWCPYCGGQLGLAPHADHIYPISKGGKSVIENLVFVCSDCNNRKRDLTIAMFIRKYALDRGVIEGRLEQLGKEF